MEVNYQVITFLLAFAVCFIISFMIARNRGRKPKLENIKFRNTFDKLIPLTKKELEKSNNEINISYYFLTSGLILLTAILIIGYLF